MAKSCMSFRAPHPLPGRPLRPQIRTPRPDFCPPSPKLGIPGLNLTLPQTCPSDLKFAPHTSNLPFRPQICPSGFKLSPCASSLTTRLQISPPGLNFALQASNLPSKPQICPTCIPSALQASNQPSAPQICPPDLKLNVPTLT